jgi:hypothetical protein
MEKDCWFYLQKDLTDLCLFFSFYPAFFLSRFYSPNLIQRDFDQKHSAIGRVKETPCRGSIPLSQYLLLSG